jgi:hypothetical protein
MDKKKPRKSRTPPARKREPAGLTPAAPELLIDLQRLIRTTRGQVAQAVNSALVLLNWEIGHRIRTEILGKSGRGTGAGACFE